MNSTVKTFLIFLAFVAFIIIVGMILNRSEFENKAKIVLPAPTGGNRLGPAR